MSQPGIGAMLHLLSGGSKNDPSKYVGRVIESAAQDGDTLVLSFRDGTSIVISDDGQSCCESRYMRTDDSLKDLFGLTLTGIETNTARSGNVEDDYEHHEVVFLDIKTDKNVVQFSFHNVHNGYYGGFGLNISERAP